MKLIIADDHPIVRRGLYAIFTAEGFDMIADVDRAEDAVRLASETPVDLVTMDLRFPSGMSGVEAVTALRALPHPPAVLVLTNYDNDSEILAAISAGAQGYLLKDAPPEALVDAARRAVAGDSVMASAVATKLFHRLREPAVTLTKRETEVLERLALGMSNKEIGADLYLSQPTVKSHLATLYTKLGVPSRTAALAKARELGFID